MPIIDDNIFCNKNTEMATKDPKSKKLQILTMQL